MAKIKYRRIGILIAAIYIVLASILSFYFIFLNNSILILYSFAFFIALGLAIAHNDRYIKYSISASIGIIVVSSLMYFFFQKSVYSTFAINLAIIGYYLLISVVIAIFSATVADNSNMHPGKKLVKMLKGHERAIYAALAVVAILALFLPIWPSSSYINYAILPHATIHISSISHGSSQGHDGPYLLVLNLSNYSSVVNPQGSNLRLVYQNGTKAMAAEYNIGGIQVGNYTEEVLLESPLSNGSDINLYFYPFNATYSSDFLAMSAGAFIRNATNSSVVSLSIGNLSNVKYRAVNETITAYAVKHGSSSSNYTITLLPYYDLQTECSMGNDSVSYLNFTSNHTVSMFLFSNISDFSLSTTSSSTSNPTYDSYLGRFSQNSYSKYINTTRLNEKFGLSGCIYYSFVTGNETRIAVQASQKYIYYLPYTEVKSFALPTIENATQKRTSFVWDSIAYTFYTALNNESTNAQT
ncbi:MAG: hypothetical protein ACP5MZ_00890 [Candidatus Micrarchaeia archaeon]